MIQMFFEKGLFVIEREQPAGRNAVGERMSAWQPVGDPVDGRLDQLTTVEGEAIIVNRFRATMPYGTDLRPSDRVRVNGSVYEVTGKPNEQKFPGFVSLSIVAAVLEYVGEVQ